MTAIEWSFFNLSFYFLILMTTCFFTRFAQFSIEQNWAQLRKPLLTFALTSLLGTGLIFINNPREMKVSSDEACILSVANQFTATHKPYNVTEGKYYFDMFHSLNPEKPVRPLLFPFFISLMQKLFGTSLASGIATNGVIAFLSLFLTQIVFFETFHSLIIGILGGVFIF